MSAVVVELPSLLAGLVGGARTVDVEAATLSGALAAVVARHPALAPHLFDERGELRPHVLCFHNGRNSRWDPGRDPALARGDRVTILQAVSGG